MCRKVPSLTTWLCWVNLFIYGASRANFKHLVMFIFKALLVLATCLSWSLCKLDSYCSICEDHTLCKYHEMGKACVNVGAGGISEEEEKEIVDTHNWLRKIVAGGFESRGTAGPQPKAANMRKLVWDEELAKVAQRWSDQCRFEHDTCRNDKRWKVGQNIYWKFKYPNHQVNWTEAIISWYNEVALFNPTEVESYRFESDTGHYTQMMWHDTYTIGCGRRDYGYNKLYVCNYGPTGNWIGEPVYTVGEPCSKCPKGTSCDEYLCGVGNNPSKPVDITLGTLKGNEKDSLTTGNETVESATGQKKDALHVREVHAATTNSIEEDTNEIDEETRKGLDNINNEIEKFVKSVIKRLKAKV